MHAFRLLNRPITLQIYLTINNSVQVAETSCLKLDARLCLSLTTGLYGIHLVKKSFDLTWM